MTNWTLAIHGGAGHWLKERSDDERAIARSALQKSLQAGSAILAAGGSACDAVIAAVRILEDDPSFNSCIGAALTADGTVELDAGLMDGRDGNYGAVAGVQRLRSPILAARCIMKHSPHTFMIAKGAETFCLAHDCEEADPTLFITPTAQQDLIRHNNKLPNVPKGTVGAVAKDKDGHYATATSTGGLTGKLPGRVGDTPIPGGGTWADTICAISATGDGELFMRTCFAHRIARDYATGLPATTALQQALTRVADLGGMGGGIMIDKNGTAHFNMVNGDMARGWQSDTSAATVAISVSESCD